MSDTVTMNLTGGDKLTKMLREMKERLTEAKSVEVGFFPEDIHPKNGLPVATVAFMNEMGDQLNEFEGHPAPIPPRPFMAQTVAEHGPEWAGAYVSALHTVQYHAAPALEGMGNLIQMQIRNAIFNWSAPMNSPLTVKLKGFNDPLVETGFMADHVKFKVEKE